MRMFARVCDGAMMAHSNRRCVVWVIADVLRIQANESILEVGFGPGVGIECLVKAGAGMSIESGLRAPSQPSFVYATASATVC
jgi:hypothetical protein